MNGALPGVGPAVAVAPALGQTPAHPAPRPVSLDRAVVVRAIDGDHAAFTALAGASIAKLFGIARLILRDSDLAEDAVQDALVSAWRDLSALRDPDRFEAWLHRLLVRACYGQIRRSRRIGRIEGSVRMIDVSEPDASRAVADRDELAHAFHRLDPEQRTLLTLHFYVGLPLAEIATILELPIGTVKSRIHRTTQQMRADLDSEGRIADTKRGSR